MNEKRKLLEVLLFLENSPIKEAELSQYLGVSQNELDQLIMEYQTQLEQSQSALRVVVRDSMVSIEPQKEILDQITNLYEKVKKKRFSDSAIEVLGIIAFKQPCTKNDIEKIRGVDSSYGLKNLLKEGFIKIVGKKESLGNPSLYGTTQQFLYYFGLKNLDELPNIEDFKNLY